MGKVVFPLVLVVYLLETYTKSFDDYTCWLSGERSLPFGLLVCICKNKDADQEKVRDHLRL